MERTLPTCRSTPFPPPCWLLVRLVEGGVEGDIAAREVETANEAGGLGTAVHAVHADVLPFDRKRPAVADVIERDDHILELDIAAAG